MYAIRSYYEDVFLDRTDQGLKPGFLKGEGLKAPSAHTVAEENRSAM